MAALIFTLCGCVGAPVQDEPADPDTGRGDTDTDSDSGTLPDTDSDSGTLPATGWTTAAPMPTRRHNLCGAWGADGRLYAIGGVEFGVDWLDTVEAYDPDLDAWTTVAPLPEPRFGCSAVTGDDGLIYVVGGQYTYENGGWSIGLSADLLAYDPDTDKWTELAPMSIGRTQGAAVWVDGTIWAIGGNERVSPGPWATIMDTVEIYDPVTDEWFVAGDTLNHARSNHAAVYAGGKIYVVGSMDGLPQVKEPGTTGWATLPAMPRPRDSPAAAPLTGGDVLVVGGCGGVGCSDAVEHIAEIWSPTTSSWTRVADLQPGRQALFAATGPDGAVHVLGGLSWWSTYSSNDHNVWR